MPYAPSGSNRNRKRRRLYEQIHLKRLTEKKSHGGGNECEGEFHMENLFTSESNSSGSSARI
jgi:hypothetical protein